MYDLECTYSQYFSILGMYTKPIMRGKRVETQSIYLSLQKCQTTKSCFMKIKKRLTSELHERH